MKTIGGMRRPMLRCTDRVGWSFTFVAAAYNLVRLPKLLSDVRKSQNPIVGRWRIIEADLWDRDYLDLCGPAMLIVGTDGQGEIAYGAMQAALDIAYGADDIDFKWCGFDEMDEARGSGSAELQDDGSISIEIAYHLGDEAVLRATREPSSASC